MSFPTRIAIRPGGDDPDEGIVLLPDGTEAPEGYRVIEGLKSLLGKSASGPAAAYPLSGEQLNVIFLGRVLKAAAEAALGLPRTLVVATPTDWTAEQVDAYRDTIRKAMASVGISIPGLETVDQATAGGVGCFQGIVEEVGGPAARLMLTDDRGECAYVAVDIGDVRTHFSAAMLTVTEVEGRFVARTRLVATTTVPYGGHALTRLVLLRTLASLAPKLKGYDRLAAEVRSDAARLASQGPAGFDDPFLVGLNLSTRRLIEALSDLVPPRPEVNDENSRAVREVLFEVAEWTKVTANVPGQVMTGSEAGAARTLDGPLAGDWAGLMRHLGANDGGALPTADPDAVARLFRPALESLVDVLAGLCHVHDRPVNAICLTGNGSRLRQLGGEVANLLLEKLPEDRFDPHRSRIHCPRDRKVAISRGAFAIHHAEAEARDWVWCCQGLLEMQPYDLGRKNASGDFVVLVPRGTKLPHAFSPPFNPRQLTLWIRDYPGASPRMLGTLSFEPVGKAEPLIRIDEARRITNQHGEPIAVPVRPDDRPDTPGMGDFDEPPPEDRTHIW